MDLALADRIALATRALYAVGQLDVRGHASAKLPDAGNVLITGHLHVAHTLAGDVTRDDIVEVDLDGQLIEGASEPPNEVFIHTAIYAMRPDVGGVVHVHPTYATALSMTGARLEPISQLALGFENGVADFDDPWSVSSKERGDLLAAALGNTSAILMRGHGAAVVGRTVEEAAARALVLEDAARLQHLANGFGEPRPIDIAASPTSQRRWLAAMEAEYLPTAWTFMVSKT